MKVDLNMLPISKFWGILEWCIDNDIDTDKCVELIGACGVSPVPDIEWSLEIPEKYITWFILKWL